MSPRAPTSARAEAVPGGIHQHLHAVKRVRFDHVAERIRSRLATAEESRLLKIGKRTAVLNLLLAVYDADDRPCRSWMLSFPVIFMS